MNYDVFISYSRKDTPVADRVCAALDAAGISYFIDRQGIAGGLEFPDVLAEAILNSRLFLLLASRNSYESKFTGSEITFAFNKKEKNTILPYIIDDSELPIGMQLVFSSINWRNINQHPLEVLTADLCALLGRPHNPVAQASTPTKAQITKWYNDGVDASERGDHAEAVRLYTLAANEGHTFAQYNLAQKYANGRGVAENQVEAARLFRLAADAGDADAQCSLGYRYEVGKGVPQDHSEALRLYRLSAAQDNATAFYNLGLYYKSGKGGIKKDPAEARRCFRKAADKGDQDAIKRLQELDAAEAAKPTPEQLTKCYNDGVAANSRGDYAEAVRLYTLAANAGHTFAQYNLAIKYSKGEGVAQDETEAVRLFRVAAEKGDSDAQCALGYRYATGKGVPQDKREAARLYRKAAEQGNTVACYNLGIYYKNGTGGLPVDINEARKWLQKAADKGDDDARRHLKEIDENEARKQTSVELSRLFNNGVDASRRGDHAEAVRLYTLAANAGHTSAQYNLAYKYANGEGVQENQAEATRLFRLAADSGDADAQCALGYRYDVGKGVPQDQREAARLYRLSADKGSATACYNLYIYYKNGMGSLPKDLSEAHRWLRKAADKGHEKARETLSKI